MVTTTSDINLMAHLMRRAGFGATKSELEKYTELGYEQTVDSLLEERESDDINNALIRRYFPDQSSTHDSAGAGSYWVYRLVTTDQPLREKIALMWHNIFATGYAKVTNGKPLTDQMRMFRQYGLGRLDELLLELSKNPAMIIWLDNIDNHKGAINENFGRELLELFSMGVGNYTEDDIKEASRAFTGWTVQNREYTKTLAVRNSIWPYGKIAWRYEYDETDHDNDDKHFLGETGNFNGEDIIEIICQEPATARFISRHLYQFFVADEPPVPQWPYEEPQDPEAIKILEDAYFEHDHNIGEMIRVLLNSDFFKSDEIRFRKVKSPVELAIGVLRTTQEFSSPRITLPERNMQIAFMGQQLVNPPSVEGWHQGTEWIETGSMLERINFASAHLGGVDNPGVKDLIGGVLDGASSHISAEAAVDRCLDELGAIQATEDVRDSLVEFAYDSGLPQVDLIADRTTAEEKVASLLSLIGTIPEYQRS